MLSLAEISRGTYGAWRLALTDPDGLKHFDDTPEAFWRSFRVMVIVLPVYILALWLRGGEGGASRAASPGLEIMVYVVGWLAFPVAMVHVCDYMGRFDRYLRYIVANNWSATVKMSLFAVVLLLDRSLGLGALGTILQLASFVAILVYHWFIARTALSISGAAAAAIVGLDLALMIFIEMLALSLV